MYVISLLCNLENEPPSALSGYRLALWALFPFVLQHRVIMRKQENQQCSPNAPVHLKGKFRISYYHQQFTLYFYITIIFFEIFFNHQSIFYKNNLTRIISPLKTVLYVTANSHTIYRNTFTVYPSLRCCPKAIKKRYLQ